jgi:inorganic pyrophosphatase
VHTLTGLIFRIVGYFTNRPLLGAEVLAGALSGITVSMHYEHQIIFLTGYLMFSTVTGILMALFMDNVGGAWDNAKKYIELGIRFRC